MKQLFLGVDIGSTTLKAALLDENCEVLETLYTRTQPQKAGFVNCINRCSDCGACYSGAVKTQIGKFLKKANVSFKELKAITITGSQVIEDTQKFILFDFQVSEISAHIAGAQFFFPEAEAILDVGGQDSKAMIFKDKMWFSKMSDICAAGTGSFLDAIASKLNISVEDIANKIDFNSELEFSSVCAVLGATSVNKFKNRYPLGQILAGACKAQARTIMSGVGELLFGYKGNIIFQGGVSSNSAVVHYLKEITQQNILVPKFNQVMGAIGAGILACQNSISKIKPKKSLEKTPTQTFKALQLRAKLNVKEFLAKSDKPLVWRNLFYPVEILNALGVRPFTLETYAALNSRNQKRLKTYLDNASQRGFKAETCSFLRVLEGMPDLPKPAFVISTSAPCHQAERILKDLAEQQLKIESDKFFTVSIPAHARENAVQALAEELELSVELMEKATGHKMEISKLQEACELSNIAREYSDQCNDLRAKYAGLVKGSELAYHSIIFSPFWGRPELVEMQKTLYEEMLLESEKFQAIDRPARHKIIFLHLPPFYSNKLLTYIEDHCHADIIIEETNYTGWKPLNAKKPYYSLAERLLQMGFINQEERVKAIKNFVNKNNIDGILAYNHGFGRCSMLDNVFIQALKAELKTEKQNAPLLIVDGDCLDASIDPCSTYTKINAFFEALNAQKFGSVLGLN